MSFSALLTILIKIRGLTEVAKVLGLPESCLAELVKRRK